MTTHYLKTIQPYFEEVRKGNKQFEVRRNDRNFNVGDLVVLQEFIDGTLTGNTIDCGAITYVLKDFPALQDGFVVFGFNSDQGNKERKLQKALAIVQQVCDLTCAMMKDQAIEIKPPTPPETQMIKEGEKPNT